MGRRPRLAAAGPPWRARRMAVIRPGVVTVQSRLKAGEGLCESRRQTGHWTGWMICPSRSKIPQSAT